MEKKISYLNRTYSDYKNALIEMSKKYYPELATSFDDASIAAWQIDVAADIADNLSYHIDRVYQETNIDSAQERASLYSMARNAGVKIPGPKGSMAEVKITAVIPGDYEGPNLDYAPVIKKGTKFTGSSQIFELQNDVDFSEQFDDDNVSNETIVPNEDSNETITSYTVTKLAVVTAGETKVFRKPIRYSDVQPFMEVLLPITNVMNIESIITVDGTDVIATPKYGAFYSHSCSDVTRFYEVDNLAQNWCWVEKENENGGATTYQYADNQGHILHSVTRGEWKPVTHKFITEYTDKGYLKITFGAGVDGDNVEIGSDASSFAKWQMSKILNNNKLGVLPNPNTTMFILYRAGGGASGNLPKGSIDKISSLNADFRGQDKSLINMIMRTLKVESTTPSVSGRDIPNEHELRYLIKYHKSAQERCVTVKDYIDRLLMLPPKYGTPFRVGVTEENNKIMIYLLGINYEGKLDSSLPTALVKNIEDYLSAYKMVNDYVEIKMGRIINLSFDVDVITDKNYNKIDIIKEIVNTITDYMDVNKHMMGDEIYVGDIEKEVSKIDGVINLISLRVYNEVGMGYSSTPISQETNSLEDTDERTEVDLEATDGILYNEGDTMMEILNPSRDIRVRLKER